MDLDENNNIYYRAIGTVIKNNYGKCFLYNGHGDVVGLADSGGNLLKKYDYDSFGNRENINPNNTNPLGYCGEYFDLETENIYLSARYYVPDKGRLCF